MDKHQIKTVMLPDHPENWFPDKPWVAFVGEFEIENANETSKIVGHFGIGSTQSESMIDWAIKNKSKLWNE